MFNIIFKIFTTFYSNKTACYNFTSECCNRVQRYHALIASLPFHEIRLCKLPHQLLLALTLSFVSFKFLSNAITFIRYAFNKFVQTPDLIKPKRANSKIRTQPQLKKNTPKNKNEPTCQWHTGTQTYSLLAIRGGRTSSILER